MRATKAKEIADHILAPAAKQNDKDARFSSEAAAALGSAGLLGIMLPSEVGGLALGPRTFAAVIATLAEADASVAMVYLMHLSAAATIATARPGAQVAQTLKDISAGRHLTTLAFSEAGSRSHFWAPVSRAKRNGAGLCVTAKKSWVTSAGHAQSYVVSALAILENHRRGSVEAAVSWFTTTPRANALRQRVTDIDRWIGTLWQTIQLVEDYINTSGTSSSRRAPVVSAVISVPRRGDSDWSGRNRRACAECERGRCDRWHQRRRRSCPASIQVDERFRRLQTKR